jgi:hypothetical protein
MLPQAKAFESLPNNKHLPTRKGSEHAETTNAEPTDAQQEQGTTTENYARAESCDALYHPCIVFRRRAILFLRRASLPARIGQKRTRMPMICFV